MTEKSLDLGGAMDSTNPWKVLGRLWRATPIACLGSGILLCMPQPSQAGTSDLPAWTSASSFGGTGLDIGEAVKVDRDGNGYLTGAFSAAAYFPTRAPQGDAPGDRSQWGPASKALTSAGGTDMFLAKYDPSGNLRWLVQAGGGADDVAYDLAFDGVGNVYVTGSFEGTATFRGTNGTAESVSAPGPAIFLAKYTASGALAWVQTGTTAFGNNEGFGVAVEPITGSVYVAGRSQSLTTFSSSNGTTYAVSGPGTWHMFLVKYDTGGNFQWGESNESGPNSVGRAVAVDEDNNAYVTGWMEGQTTFHSADGQDLQVIGLSGPVQSAPDFPGDAYVVKYDEDGDAKWVNQIGGYKAIGNDIAASRDGRVSVTGFIGNIASSLPEQTQTIVTSQAGGKSINLGGGKFTVPFNRDVFLATYDDEGLLLEARRFGDAKDEAGTGIAYDRHSNLVIAGTFEDAIKINGRMLTGKSPFNLFLAQFDREGSCAPGSGTATLDWVKEADGVSFGSFEGGARFGLTRQGNVVITGAYQPSAQFGGFTLVSAGAQDGFLSFLKAAPEKDKNREHDHEHTDHD